MNKRISAFGASAFVFSSLAGLLFTAPALAETTVTLKNMHLCCGACVRGVEQAVAKVDGANVKVNKKGGSAVVTAKDDATAQKALDAVAAAGFHAASSHESIVMKDNSGVKAGVTKRLVLTGVHNCCVGCNVAVKKALKSVDGVEADTAKPKKKEIVVEGNFDGLAVVKALNKAGFHVVAP